MAGPLSLSFAAINMTINRGDSAAIAVKEAVKSNNRLKKVYVNVVWPSALVLIFRDNNDTLIYRVEVEKSTAAVFVRACNPCIVAGREDIGWTVQKYY